MAMGAGDYGSAAPPEVNPRCKGQKVSKGHSWYKWKLENHKSPSQNWTEFTVNAPPPHTRLSMRTDSYVNYWIIAQETRHTSATPTGYVHVQPAERAERLPFWYKSQKVHLIMFA